MVTACLAITRELEKRGLYPEMTAGLSLGEYCAIAAAGSMSGMDAVRTVRARGIFMEHAAPEGTGAMAAVLGMDGEAVERTVHDLEGVFIANYNCPGQIVITGEKEAVEQSAAVLKEAGARRVLSLKVSGPFHSPMMKPAGEKLEEVLPIIWEELSPEARAVIEKQGVVYTDQEGDLVTSIVNNKDCVFTCYDEKGCCYCAIEKAYRDGKTDFYKPVSCHLYPIRIGDYGPYKAVNYHRWDVCKAAVLLGKKENVAVYQFLKEPLIRKFGEKWYQELEVAVKELKAHDMI